MFFKDLINEKNELTTSINSLKNEKNNLLDEIKDLTSSKQELLNTLINYESFFVETELKYVDSADGIEFEHYLANILERIGYKTIVTKASQDSGADIIATFNNKKLVIQCKRYSSTVGNKAVQEIYTAESLYDASEGIVATNNYFSEQAIKEAKKLEIILWDRDVLKSLIKKSYKPLLDHLNSPIYNTWNATQKHSKCNENRILIDAIELAISMGQTSASMIQRKFKVGYAEAGKIIDQMEELGIISGYDGSKPRQTLISKEEWEEIKSNL